MSRRDDWEELSPEKKLEWLYNNLNNLIDFSNRLSQRTGNNFNRLERLEKAMGQIAPKDQTKESV